MFISHYSALHFWRELRARDCCVPSVTSALDLEPHSSRLVYAPVVSLHSADISDREIMGFLPQGSALFKPPIDLLVGSPHMRRYSALKRPHAWVHPLTSGSFYKIASQVYVSSPEFCFLQMASLLDFVDLVMLAYELCGYYTVSENGMFTCTRLTSLELLGDFAHRCAGSRGARKAASALACAAEGAASPREATTAALLCLPYRHGGYALPLPQMNHPVYPRARQRDEIDGTYYVCDLFWPKANLAVEYNSDAHHASPSQIASDSRRRNALEHMNIKVVSVTNQQLCDIDQFDHAALQIAKRLHKRIRPSSPDIQWTKARLDLRSKLLGRGATCQNA